MEEKVEKPDWPPKGFEPQGQYLADMSPSDIRKTFVQIGRACLQLKTPKIEYLNLCYPDDSYKKQIVMATSQHACALTMGGIVRAAGCLDPILLGPYSGRNNAFTRLETMARQHGAWGEHDSEFEEGDIVVVGTDVPRDAPHRAKIISQWGTPGHMCLVEKIDEDGKHMTTIDGGRGPIHRTRRTFYKDDQGRMWVTGFTTRRVWGVVHVANLKFNSDVEWSMPKGPNYPGLK